MDGAMFRWPGLDGRPNPPCRSGRRLRQAIEEGPRPTTVEVIAAAAEAALPELCRRLGVDGWGAEGPAEAPAP